MSKENVLLHSKFLVSSVTGEALSKYYLPIFAPLGIIGNILSFLVSII